MVDALIAVIGIFLGAVLAWASTFYFQHRKERAVQKRLLTVLFGELLNIRQHYLFAFGEIPISVSSRKDILALKMSLYGNLAFSKNDISNLGFLNDQDITDLMQLNLKIRNTDNSIEFALDGFPNIETTEMHIESEMTNIKYRIKYVQVVSERVTQAIVKRHPELLKLLPEEACS